MYRTTIMFAAALAALCALAAAPPAAAQTILFEGARVISGDGSPAIENAAILVDNGTIVRVGRSGEVAAPADARRIALAGKTVMPAIISPHVHPGFQRGLSYSADNFTRETILGDLDRELYFGVSTAMSLGIEKGDVMYEIRAGQAAGKAGGARLMIAGRGIGAPNAGPGAAAYAHIAYEITTEDEARGAARELAAKHVDAIKIWVDDRGGRAPKLPIALSRVIIEEGHRAGLKVIAHIFYHEDALELAAAGINGFAHLVRDKEMSDELIALMIKNHVYAMPNIGAPERGTHASVPAWFTEPALAGLLRDTEPSAVVDRVRDSFTGRDAATVERNRRNYAILQKSSGQAQRRRRANHPRQRHRPRRSFLRLCRAEGAWPDGRGRHDAGAGDRRGHQPSGGVSGPRRPRQHRAGQARRFACARREPARRHPQHPPHRRALSCRHRSRSRRDQGRARQARR